MFHRAQAPGRRVRLGQPGADAGPGQQRRGVPGLGGGQAPGAALLHQGRRLQPGPVQRAGRLPGRAEPEPVRVRHHLAGRGDHGQPVALAGADHGLDQRPDAERVRGLPGDRVQRRRPDHAGGPVARAGRAAPAQRVRPRRPAARQRHGGPGRPVPPGRLRRGVDSAAGRAVTAHRVRPPELPAPLASQLGPLARYLLRPGHLHLAGGAQQGSRALAGPVQLQEPAVRQDRLLPSVQDRGLEAAGRAGRPAGRRAGQEAAGVLRPALAVQPEPGGDPGAAGRGPGAAAGPGGPALVGAAPRARRGGPRRWDPRPWSRPGVVVPAPAPAGPATHLVRGAPGAGRARARRGAPGGPQGRAAGSTPAVRAARHGGDRADAAAEPENDAAQRHDLVDPAAGRPRPGADRSWISRVRAVRAHAPRVRAPRPGPDPARTSHAGIALPGIALPG